MEKSNWLRFRDWLLNRFHGVLDNVIANFVVIVLVALIGFIVANGLAFPPTVIMVLPILAVLCAILLALLLVAKFFNKKNSRNNIIYNNHLLERFVGRTDEVAHFHAMISGQQTRSVLSIYGLPGIGKSWLISKLTYEAYKSNCLVATIDFRNTAYDYISLLEQIQYQLGAEQFEGFKKAFDTYTKTRSQITQQLGVREAGNQHILQNEERLVSRMFQKDLIDLAKQKKIVLLFDTFEKVQRSELSKQLETLFQFVAQTQASSSLFIIVAGWHSLEWRGGWEANTTYIELSSFSLSEVYERLKAEGIRGYRDRLAKNIFEYTGGHPLAIGLAITLVDTATKHGERINDRFFEKQKDKLDKELVVQLLTERILQRVDPVIAELIHLCALPRWFDADIVRIFKEDQESDVLFADLIEFRSFIQPHFPTGYEFHEIVRQLLLNKWRQNDEQKYINLNEKIYAYLNKRRDSTHGLLKDVITLDVIYHSNIIDNQFGLKVFRTYFQNALHTYELDLAAALIQTEETFLSDYPELNLEMLYRKAQVLGARDSWEPAREILSNLAETISRRDNNNYDWLLPSVYFELGNSAARLGDNEHAVELYETSLRLVNLETIDTDISSADILIELGLAYMVLGNLQKAEACLKKTDISEENSSASKIQILLHLEVLYLTQGRWRNVIKLHENFNMLSSSYKTRIDEIRDQFHLGEAYMRIGRLDDALSIFKLNDETSRDVKNRYRQVFAQIGIARVLEDQQRWDESLDQFEVTTRLYEQIVSTTLADTYRGETGRIFFKKGKNEAAREQLSRGIDAAKTLNQFGVQRELSIYLSCLDIKQGKITQGRDQLLSIYQDFSRMGHYYREAYVLTWLLEYCKESLSLSEFHSYLDIACSLATSGRYCDLLASLLRVNGDSTWHYRDHEKYMNAGVIGKAYFDACRISLLHNRYALDFNIERIFISLDNLARNGAVILALEICKHIRSEWISTGLNVKETIARNNEVGDSLPQTDLLTKFQREESILLIASKQQ